MSEPVRPVARAVLDTSVVVDLGAIDLPKFTVEAAISAVTLAELSAGPAATGDPNERARRQDRLQRAEASFDPLPFGVAEARAYGRVHAAIRAQGRQPRRRFAELLIAATALAAGVPVLTRNRADFAGLDDLITIIEV